MIGQLAMDQLKKLNSVSSPMKIIHEIQLQKSKLGVFKNIQENCKIGKYNNEDYYIVQPGYLQKFWRYWYSEDRNKTWEYLDSDFTIFARLLDQITYKLSNNDFNTYKKYAVEIVSFIDDILPGLYNLKQTYKETVKIVAKVDSIILTLIDFKENISKIKKQQNINIQRKYRNPHIQRFSNSWDL